MDTARTMSITEGRKRIFDLAEKAQVPGAYFTLTEKGKPRMILMSAQELESLLETIEVLRDFPDIAVRTKEADRAVKTGDFSNYISLDVVEKKLGIPKKTVTKHHAVPRRNSKARTKGTRKTHA